MHLESAAAWAGHKLEAASLEVVNSSRSVGTKIVKGSAWTAQEVGKALENLGKNLEKLAW